MPQELPNQGSLSLKAYQRLKRDIIEGDLRPDAHVTESELASRLGVGRTPVREALARLAGDRLVRVLPRRGYLVAPIDLRDLREMYSMRMLLEPEAARLAAQHARPQQLRQIEDVCRTLYDRSSRTSVAVFLRVHTRFHASVARACGHLRLAGAIPPLLDEMERVLHIGLRLRDLAEMAPEHRALATAITAGRDDLASDLMLRDLRASETAIVSGLLGTEVPVA